MTNTVGVIIPARGGSKGIPHKNLKLINGRRLIDYPLRIAAALVPQERIVVTSDSGVILSAAQERYPDIIMRRRPPELATDEITLDPVLVDAANCLDTSIVITLLPTCPFLKVSTLQHALNKFNTAPLLAAVATHEIVWDTSVDKQTMRHERTNRQCGNHSLIESGAFSICNRRGLICSLSRYYYIPDLFPISKGEAFDIDEPEDLEFARRVRSV